MKMSSLILPIIKPSQKPSQKSDQAGSQDALNKLIHANHVEHGM